MSICPLNSRSSASPSLLDCSNSDGNQERKAGKTHLTSLVFCFII